MSTQESIATTGRAKRLWAGALALVCLVVAGVALHGWLRARVLEVPLGVEHAVTLRYSGPDLVTKPFDLGVAVHLRIAGVVPSGNAMVYDIRYIVDRPGDYNILDYLTSASGEPPANLPSFAVRAIPRNATTLERRIQTLEPADIRFWHRYRELLMALAVIWLAWLAALVFWHRHHQRKSVAAPPDYEAFYRLLRSFLDRLGAGGLDAAGKLALEKLMLGWWRDHARARGQGMAAVVRELAADPVAGGAFQALECWLHDSRTTIQRDDVIRALTPYTMRRDATPRAPAAESEARP